MDPAYPSVEAFDISVVAFRRKIIEDDVIALEPLGFDPMGAYDLFVVVLLDP